MRPSYPHKHITSEGCCLRHRWCGLGFCHDDRVNLFQGISHPNIRQYKMSMVGWLCLDHTSGVVGWNRFFYPIYFPSFYFILFYWLVIDSWQFTCLLGLWGQFTAIFPRPPQYRHRWFARRRCFSSSDNSPRRRVVSFPLVLAYLHKMHYINPLEKVLLRLIHMWALILSLTFLTVILNIVRKADYRIALLDWLSPWATSVL